MPTMFVVPLEIVMTKQTVTRSIELPAARPHVFGLLVDASRVPEWAPVFADQITHVSDNRWLRRKGDREFDLVLVHDHACGSVDYLRDLPTGRQGGAFLRVLDAPASGSVVTMTVPIGPDSTAEEATKIVDDELKRLRDLF
jgi:hypothetical protein